MMNRDEPQLADDESPMTHAVECARCSQPVTDFLVSTLGGVFHQHCWAVLSSERLRTESQKRIRSTEEHVSRTLNRLRTPRRGPTSLP